MFSQTVARSLDQWRMIRDDACEKTFEAIYGSPWIQNGPFRLYETGASDGGEPLYYADWIQVPGHPEFDGQFFNCATEIRDGMEVGLYTPEAEKARRSVIEDSRDNYARSMELAQQALPLLPTSDTDLRSMLTCFLGKAYWGMGRIEQAEMLLWEAHRDAMKAQVFSSASRYSAMPPSRCQP